MLIVDNGFYYSRTSCVRRQTVYKMDTKGGRWAGRTALVTGGNSGIGTAVVRKLTDIGVHVVSIDKTIDKLQVNCNDFIPIVFGSEI